MKTESVYLNRELSWLDFDRRILDLAGEGEMPLAERLKFLSIYASNLDEFFMVRVGSLCDRMLTKKGREQRDECTNMTPEQQLFAIYPRVEALQGLCDATYDGLLLALKAEGYEKINFSSLTKEEEHFWKKYFQSEIFPILSPQILDGRHPFPFLRNGDIYLCFSLINTSKTAGESFGIIPVSNQMERVLYTKTANGFGFCLIEELIAHYADVVFGKNTIRGMGFFRVTRNADISADEARMDHDIDYRDIMTDLLKKRKKLSAVRLQLSRNTPLEIEKFLREKLKITPRQVQHQHCPLELKFLFKLAGRLATDGRAELCYSPAKPMLPPAGFDLEAAVKQQDVLLCYPYQSIRPFIAMLEKAAYDPEVISIKMTLYRMANDSKIVHALIKAAENGKEVFALVELRARFDEQNNIDWSKQLEEAGCTVVYGYDHFKVHSKLTLITKKRGKVYSYITQIGTGNYNEHTSEQYTDLSYITASPQIGEEAARVFQKLAVRELVESTQHLLVAPYCFKSTLLEEMQHEIDEAKLGRPARIILKNNAINDTQIIEMLLKASQMGVEIDMIVRGICCIRAEVPGITEHLHVRSIVGRYLEHSRIYSFGSGENQRVYIASGDFLTRNTNNRVEVGVKIRDPALIKRLNDLLQLQLQDNTNARLMQADGSYYKVLRQKEEKAVDGQMDMYELFRSDWKTLMERFAQIEPPAMSRPAKVQKTMPDVWGWLKKLLS